MRHHPYVLQVRALLLTLSVLLLNVFGVVNAFAMTFETRGNTLFAAGFIEEDYLAFKSALENPAVDTLVLVNSRGGDLWTGVRIGRLVVERNLKTIVVGQCSAACTVIFVGGVQRQFSKAFPAPQTYLGVRGFHDKNNLKIRAQASPEVYAFFKTRLHDKFNPDIMQKAFYEMQDIYGMLRMYDHIRGPQRFARHCPTNERDAPSCTDFKEHNAFTLGFITSEELAAVDLPDSMKPQVVAFGHLLSTPFPNLNTFLAQEAKNRCLTPRCIQRITAQESAADNSALAFSIKSGRYGDAEGYDTVEQALGIALARCNFATAKSTELCEVQLINGLDTRGLNPTTAGSKDSVLDQIVVPSSRFYDDEELGGLFVNFEGLRTSKLNTNTPKSLPSITTIGTQELAKTLKEGGALQLIDVGGRSGMSLPSAQLLANGGTTRPEGKAEQSVSERFERLLSVMAPRRDQPLVFFCYSKDSWLSVNAAVRAQRLGYEKVIWYRGGMAAWQAAGLPVVKTFPKAYLLPE